MNALGYVVTLVALWLPAHQTADQAHEWRHSMMSGTWSLPVAKILSNEDVTRILARAKELSHRDWIFFATAVNTGLRLCEVLHIDKDEIQGDKLIVVRRKKKILKAAPIDIAPALAVELRKWAENIEAGWIFPGESQPCFIRHLDKRVEQVCCGGHISKREIQRRWTVILRELGIYTPGRGIHSTRHHAITELAESQASDQTVMSIAGHVSPRMLAHYSHVRLEAKRQALNALVSRLPEVVPGKGSEGSYVTTNGTNEPPEGLPDPQVIESSGRRVVTRTPDLYRVKVAL